MKSFVVFLVVLFSTANFAQSDAKTVEMIQSLALDADDFIGYDKFDYSYHVKNNILFKTKNNERFEYKNLPLGQITKVDLLNPLKVIVFYERFNTVITLDSQLNETLKIDFSQPKKPLVVSKVGIASQNQLWVFDELSQQLFLYDTINGSLKAVGTPISEPIAFYSSDFNYFSWVDKTNTWYQSSIFGMVERLDYRFEFDSILFADSILIVYQKEGKIIAFIKDTQNYILIENSVNSIESVTFKNQILTIFTAREIKNYKIKLR